MERLGEGDWVVASADANQGAAACSGLRCPSPGCSPPATFACCSQPCPWLLLLPAVLTLAPCPAVSARDAEMRVLSQRHSQAELKVLQRLCSGGFFGGISAAAAIGHTGIRAGRQRRCWVPGTAVGLYLVS